MSRFRFVPRAYKKTQTIAITNGKPPPIMRNAPSVSSPSSAKKANALMNSCINSLCHVVDY